MFEVQRNRSDAEVGALWRSLRDEFFEFSFETWKDVEEDNLYARGASDDNGEVVFDDGAQHGHGEAVGEVGLGCLSVHKVDACAACCEYEAAEGEEEVYGDALGAADVEFPGEDEWHGIEDEVGCEHEA